MLHKEKEEKIIYYTHGQALSNYTKDLLTDKSLDKLSNYTYIFILIYTSNYAEPAGVHPRKRI
jgi:hypothetical protein